MSRLAHAGTAHGAVAASVLGAAVMVCVVAGPARAVADTSPAAMLERARAATAAPHTGQVTIVSFTDDGPRVTELAVTVEDGAVVMRPARLLLPVTSDLARIVRGAGDDSTAQIGDDDARRVPTSPLGLDVGAILERWDVEVGTPVALDTGSATPVHLSRRSGAHVLETLFVDDRTGIAVRRETRAADDRVLRVVAYTQLAVGPADELSASDARGPTVADRDDAGAAAREARAAGFDVPDRLESGFALVAVESDHDMAVARYSDGLSVLSVYQQHGALDTAALEGAEVWHVAGRDVFGWPGAEPARFVWSGDGRTWTAISDAPAAVVQDAVASLPGDLVGHDAPHRLRRGLDRVWRFVTAPLR